MKPRIFLLLTLTSLIPATRPLDLKTFCSTYAGIYYFYAKPREYTETPLSRVLKCISGSVLCHKALKSLEKSEFAMATFYGIGAWTLFNAGLKKPIYHLKFFA